VDVLRTAITKIGAGGVIDGLKDVNDVLLQMLYVFRVASACVKGGSPFFSAALSE
jgi:hypothetical protein